MSHHNLFQQQKSLQETNMNWSFIAGAFTAWIAFTPEGKTFGNNLTSKCMSYIRENYLKGLNNGNTGTNRKDEDSNASSK